MKKIDFKYWHNDFDSWIVWYGDFMYRLIKAKRVVKTKFDKEELVEALILRCAVRWELLLTRDIIASLNKDSSYYAKELGLKLRKHLTKDECEAIFLGHRYEEFRSVRSVINFGKKYLNPKFNPFKGITPNQEKIIDEFFIIRNLLAHYSSSAFRKYNSMVKRNYKLKRVPEPCRFLMSANTVSGEYRWSKYLRTFLIASHSMIKSI